MQYSIIHFLKKVVRNKGLMVFFKALILVVVLVYIYFEIRYEKELGARFIEQVLSLNTIKSYFILLLTVFLMPLNWALEALKWKVVVKPITRITLFQAFKGVLTGLSLGLVTPNRLGDYAGRIWHIDEAYRSKLIGGIMLLRMMQWWIALFFGLVGLMVMSGEVYDAYWIPVIYGLLISVILSLFFVYRQKGIRYLSQGRLKKWAHYVVMIGDVSSAILSKVLLYSGLRYLVFSTQFVLVFYLFDIELPLLVVFAGVTWVFLIKTIVPSFNFLSDLGLREFSALYFFSFFEVDVSLILSASLLVWVINILIPALTGLLFVPKMKIIRS